MNMTSCLVCLTIGFLLLCLVRLISTWEFTVVVMFFWLCYKIEIVYRNQKIITINQSNLEKLIKKEIK